MALSNIFREPRREITETVVGIVIAVPSIWLDYRFALQFPTWMEPPDIVAYWFCVALGMICGVLIPLALVLLLMAVHGIGNAVCNALQGHGLYLRPRQRR